MVIDPDIRIRGLNEGSSIDVEQFVSDFQQSGATAACPRIMIEPDGFLRASSPSSTRSPFESDARAWGTSASPRAVSPSTSEVRSCARSTSIRCPCMQRTSRMR